MRPERLNKLKKVLTNRQLNVTVVMENVHDPHNISAVLRSCDSVGILDVHIINTQDANERFMYGKKTSASAGKWLNIHMHKSVASCFELLRKDFDLILATKLDLESKSLYEIDFTGSIALVFGNEKDGVSEAAAALCDGNFIIPQVGMVQSLNISVACAVSLYEVFRQKSLKGHYTENTQEEFSGQKATQLEAWVARDLARRKFKPV